MLIRHRATVMWRGVHLTMLIRSSLEPYAITVDCLDTLLGCALCPGIVSSVKLLAIIWMYAPPDISHTLLHTIGGVLTQAWGSSMWKLEMLVIAIGLTLEM